MSEPSAASRAASLSSPGPLAVADAVVELARVAQQDLDEPGLVARVLESLARLLPERALAVRVVDPRGATATRAHGLGGVLRPELADAPLVLKEAAVAGSGMKSAVAASARLRVGARWDSPFHHVATGFAVPLVAAGELFGVLDVGYVYPPAAEVAAGDEQAVRALAGQLALALRAQHLFRDTAGLRDFTSSLVEQANALILGIDARWRITVYNRAMRELTGMTREEVLGRDLRDILPADQRTALTRRFAAALRGESQDAVVVTLPRPTGERVRTLWSLAAVGGRGAGAATIDAVVAIGQDHSRIDELQAQVVRSERLATLGQLAAGVVHELNNPLTSISVYADYLLGRAQGEGAWVEGDREKLRRIRGAAHRILQFTRELVQYAKPVGTERDEVDVNAVVRQAVSFCEHLFDRSDSTCALELAEALPTLQAVPGQLEQVLINLVTNAAHALDGRGRVVVRTAVDAGAIVLEVADDGPGVPEQDRARIFEPFFTTKTDGKGTGLGLPIVRNIVEQHRGTIAVDRADEGGARFRVVLPLA